MKLIKSLEELATHIGTLDTLAECLEEAADMDYGVEAETGLEMYKKHFSEGLHFACVEFDDLAPEFSSFSYSQVNRMYDDMIKFEEGDVFHCPMSLVEQQLCKHPALNYPVFASIEGGIVAFVIDPRDHDNFIEFAKKYS